MAISSKQVREAKAFLEARGLLDLIRPMDFAAAAAEMDKSLVETLALIAELQMGGQGVGPAPIGEEIAKEAA